MAKKIQQVGVSEDDQQEIELESEVSSVQAPEAPGGVPPKRIARDTLPPGGGDRRPKKTAAGSGFFARIIQFLHDTRAEMRRVSWPGANVVKNTTLITLVAVIFFAVYLFAVDRVWAFLIDRLWKLLGG